MYLEFRGVKHACSKGLEVFKRYIKSILSWLNGQTVEPLRNSISVKLFNILKNLFTTHYSQFTKKLFAFTLAETLIVMGVIGVVAALTLPNLNSSTGDKEKVAKVKKIYQNLNDAFGRVTAVYGPYDEWFVNDANDAAKTKRAGERLTEFMKTSKVCGMEANKGCMPNIVKYNNYQHNMSDGLDNSNYYKVVLADGTALAIQANNNIYIDIDGPNKGPNTIGRDVFVFKFAEDNTGILTYGDGSDESSLLNLSIKYGQNSSTWIIRYDNMDYLKVDSNGKCPNGKILDGVSNITCN